jgi:peptidoglycan-associated lipoprotein
MAFNGYSTPSHFNPTPRPAFCSTGMRGLAYLLLAATVCLAGCGRSTGRPPAPAPPPSPPPGAPSVGITVPGPELEARAEPERIGPGESAFLIWEAHNAEAVTIELGIGEVDTAGRMRVFPEQTSNYRLVATGPGGVTEKTVTVTVSETEPSPTFFEEDLEARSLEEKFAYFVKPVFFDYDSSELKEAGRLTLDENIRWLQMPENREILMVLEGHTDDRGTAEYNLALGDKRAQIVRAYMVERGVDPGRLMTVSLGEESPFDPGKTEEAYAFNRRVHFLLLREHTAPSDGP